MFKKWICAFLSAALIFALAACQAKPATSAESGKVRVSVTFNALYELTKAVGGDKVSVTTIIPDGSEPHDFEPKAQDLASLGSADVFIYNGLGMETWADSAAKAAGGSRLITVVASDGIEPLSAGSGESGERGGYDPHIWLSLDCAEKMAENIRDALDKADPADKAYFDGNCGVYTEKLTSLKNEYAQKYKRLSNKSFVTGHAAFAYLCRDFGLSQNSVEDVFAEGEPSARQLTQLIDYCKQNHVKTIFAESQLSAGVSDTLAREVGAQVKTIYTLESSEDGKSYLERMASNLQAIYDSLSQ